MTVERLSETDPQLFLSMDRLRTDPVGECRGVYHQDTLSSIVVADREEGDVVRQVAVYPRNDTDYCE